MYKHEDERRILVEVIADSPLRSVKVLTAKEGCIVGNHYHNFKDELFYLISGAGRYEIGDEEGILQAGEDYACPRGIKHTFWLDEGSILLGVASEPFDGNDENV